MNIDRLLHTHISFAYVCTEKCQVRVGAHKNGATGNIYSLK